MSDISSSIAEVIRKRTASVTLGTYLFFWIGYHWEGFYVTFFVSQDQIAEKFDLLKNEYVNKYFFGYGEGLDIRWILGYIIPAFLTYLLIFWVPPVLLKFYEREQKHKVDKRIRKLKEEARIEKQKIANVKKESATLDAEIERAKKETSVEQADPTIIWDKEFDNFKKNNQLNRLKDILESVYRYSGNVYVSGQFADMPEFELDANSLRFADSNGLVKIVESGKRIELTDKGKYFASKYEEDF